MRLFSETFELGNQQYRLETGVVARQADAAVMVTVGGTVLLATVVAKKDADPSRGFFPLTVNYQERTYAAGKFPGGFLKREGRPSERETLIARLIDRPIRPLFPEGFMNEVQVIITVLSYDGVADPDVAAMIGASAALSLSGVPFAGPVGACRIGYKNNEFLVNPSVEETAESELDLVVAGTKDAVLMVESEAKELPENVMLDAVMAGHEAMQTAIDAINKLKAEAGKPEWTFEAPKKDEALVAKVQAEVSDAIADAFSTTEKQSRRDKLSALQATCVEKLCPADQDDAPDAKSVNEIIHSLEKSYVRSRILSGERRIDGRENDTVRALNMAVGVLPRTHGSALFTRGETQALVVTTLGTERDAQLIDGLHGESKDAFLLHYNFPPYCVGETGMMMSPKRREIGHGRLAKRSIQAVMPNNEDFPYSVRVVSEITESNGSSSMASVCGTSMALMDAGVPIKAPVAGIAMGLVKDGDRHVVLSDIMGDEDHLGDMDFKVAGTEKGLTALQMDIKIDGITRDIMQQALQQANAGRLHILSVMNQAINTARDDVSPFAPRITTIKINPDKIRDVIGKGGATIRALTEETGTTIELDDDGTVRIAAVEQSASDLAIAKIEALTAEVEVDKLYTGKVVRIADFGAFVNLLPGKDGLLHISQICHERVENVRDKLSEGQEVTVKVIEIDRQGRVRLTMKDVEPAKTEDASEAEAE